MYLKSNWLSCLVRYFSPVQLFFSLFLISTSLFLMLHFITNTKIIHYLQYNTMRGRIRVNGCGGRSGRWMCMAVGVNGWGAAFELRNNTAKRSPKCSANGIIMPKASFLMYKMRYRTVIFCGRLSWWCRDLLVMILVNTKASPPSVPHFS